MKSVSILGVMALLSACGPMNQGGLGNNFLGMVSGEEATVAAPSLPSDVEGNVLFTTLSGKNATAALVRQTTRGDTTTWISPGQVTLTLVDDILVTSRGLGNDLMGADIAGVRGAIRTGSGSTTRVHSFLDSQDQIYSITLNCTYDRIGPEEVTLVAGPRTLTRVDENCASPQLVFTNSYWMSGDTIVRFKQAISPTEGFMIAEAL